MNHCLAWITWNPPREIFHIPYIDHPVTWYGLFFASGIAICYLILIHILKVQIGRTGTISTIWILDWDKFLKQLKNSSLAPALKASPGEEKKQEVVSQLNLLINERQFAPSRKEGMEKLKQEFPKTFMSAYDASFYLIDRLLWYAILGTLIGARLGHILFYDISRYLQHPHEILMVWHGGLASHGAAIGLLLATYLYYRRYRESLPGKGYFAFLDLFVIPIPIAGAFIRCGNFVNQEILGKPATVPWAIIFANPVDGGAVLPRHPVMLYEAMAYIAIFGIQYALWKYRGFRFGAAFFSGLFFTLVFTARFFLEFFKVAQTDTVIIPGLLMGQVLSIPFIVLGLVLIMRSYVHKYTQPHPFAPE